LPQPKGFNVFSQEQDVQLGQQYSAEVNQQMPILPETSPISQYVRRIGQSLVAQLPQTPYAYSFRVVQQKDINAFALPGGPVYVNMGILQTADNEAEVAGVIGHELAHVYMRHSTRQASKQVLAQVPLAIVGGMLGGGVMGQLAQMGIGFGVNSVFLKYSRDAESEADLVGTMLMYRVGYNPTAAADFFQKLQQEGGSRGPEFLSSHPDPGNREVAIRKQVSGYATRSYRQDNAEFNRIKAQVEKTKSYTAEEIAKRAQQQSQTQGTMRPVTATEIKPSQTFRNFQHNSYRIAHPDNWQVFGDRSSSVTIAPRAGVSQNAIAYGVIINGFQPQDSSSLNRATSELLASLRQSNPEMRQIGRTENIRVNGVNAKSVDMVGVSPIAGSDGKPLRERDWLVVLPQGRNQLVYLVFVSPDQDFPQLRPAFEQMLRSLRVQQ
jgi:hypothetical protein